MDMFAKKAASTKECITPHKISLLVIISELCDRVKDEITPFRKHRHALMLLVLNLMQTADIEFNELRKKLDEIDHEHTQLTALLLDRLNSISDGESSVCDFFLQNLDDLLNVEEEIVLTRTSFFGLFVRKMVLLFNKMSFGQVLQLTTLLKAYLHASHVHSTSDTSQDMDLNGDLLERKMPMSSQQGQNFLAKQATLLQSCEQDAESPAKLQEQIATILHGAPDLAEAHFVQYLNCIRVGELNQALDCLYHYFDRKQWEEGSKSGANSETSDVAKKDRCKRFCYAGLNLAILHTHFGHRKQALTVLQESIRIAQESNDHICLAHGLKLLYKLKQDGDSQAKHILERFSARSAELKLPYLESLSLIMKTNRMVFTGEPPPRVLGIFEELNMLNSEKALLDLAATTHMQQAACLQFYGLSNIAVVYSQYSLKQWRPSVTAAFTDNVKGSGMINSEAKLRALCFLASHVSKQGNFAGSMKLLDFAESICPENSKDCKIWQAEKQRIIFDQAIMMEDWQTASETAENLRVFDAFDSDLRKAGLSTKLKQFRAAHEMLRKLLECLESNVKEEKCVDEMKANVYLAIAEVFMASKDYPSSMTHLLECKTICDSYHMQNFSIIASLHIAEVQFHLGLPKKAFSSLRQIMINALSNGCLFTVSCTKLLFTRCQLQQNEGRGKDERMAVLLSALPTLDSILKDFKQIHAAAKIREVLLFQAFIYHELGYTEKRNECSIEFRALHTADGKTISQRVSTLLPDKL